MPPILLCSDIRNRCWWDSRRNWTFPPIFFYILFLCDRWQQRGTLKKWCLVRNCLWRKGVELNSSMQKELHPLMFTDTYWMFWRPNSGCEHWGSGWCISATVTATWKTSPVLDGHAQLSYKAVTDTRWRASSPAHLHESANGDDCVEKQYFVAENLLYQIVLLWSLFSFSWK